MNKLLFEKIIQCGGSITYSDYIDLVLYDPEHGYYTKNQNKIGPKGDFYTSSSVSDCFAKVFARRFISLVEQSLIEPAFCEIGGGTGKFLSSFLSEWKKQSPKTYEILEVTVIDKSPFHLELQRENSGLKSIQFLERLEELEASFNGIFFSNELFDALPVHVIEKRNGELFEVWIEIGEKDTVVEQCLPLANEEIKNYLIWQKLQINEGQRIEIPLKMLELLDVIDQKIKSGLIITVDYGYTNEEWSHPVHHNGSLRGYYKHRMIQDPLQHPFNMDLTTHIHLDAYRSKASLFTWELIVNEKQDEFLVNAGVLDLLQDTNNRDPFSPQSKQNRSIRSLIMSGGLSSAFDVMIHSKGVSVRREDIIS
ncbi:class I SAM-dependent methyltransferase [Metabacillus herbersteinensis]|uniref:Class I SAM-dependent methyltransferase n=1 Tax=Metabacillus herbersteinensis TaxID=283816 RepID=A0ABV6G8L8_9BACI